MAPPGRRKFPSLTTLLPFLLLAFLCSTAHAASAVLGIDLGTEYLKAAIAKPGSPIEIVLSKDSKRREAATLAFKPSRAQSHDDEAFPERLYGGDAVALSARFPSDVFPNLKGLLGLEYGDEAVTRYAVRYPGPKIESIPRSDSDKQKGTVGFKSQSFGAKRNEVFMVEELLAMELKNIKSNAETMVAKGVFVSDVVITYPAFYTADERRAIELAADLAGLRVLGLVSDGVAVGLNYATHRTFDSVTEGGKPEYHLVYDMGAGSTTATVLKFQGRTIKGSGYAKRNQTAQEVIALGTGIDATLGGDALNDVIVEDILSQFVEAEQVKKLGLKREQIQKHAKTMARIWKEAERIRHLLSANAVSSATLEGLYDDDVTFKYSLTREKFEDLAADHAARVGSPLEAALQSSGLTLDHLDSIILHGGAVRTPFVQKQLEKIAGGSSKLKANVNADEAAVMGAAFKAAALSPSFRVKDIRDTDISGFAFNLKWNVEGKEKSQKLFTPSSQIGAEKQVPLKTLEDVKLGFDQTVGDKELPVLEVDAANLTKSVVELKDKHGCGAANISTTFNIRLSVVNGLPEVLSGTVSCETENGKSGTVMDNVKGLFGFGSKNDREQKVLEDDDTTEESAETPLQVSDPTSSGSTMSSASPSPAESSASYPPSSASISAKAGRATPSVVSIPLSFKSTVVGLNAPPLKSLPRVRQRLTQFDTSDRNTILRAEALNTLEAFTYRARDYLEDESFIGASSVSSRKELEKQLSSISEWLYGDGLDAKLQDFKDKLKNLRGLIDPVLKRKDEAVKRPDAIKALKEGLESLNSMIKMVEGNIQRAVEDAASSSSEAASSTASSVTASTSSTVAEGDDLEEDPYSTPSATEATETEEAPPFRPYQYTAEDLSQLTTKYDTVMKWFQEKLALQEKLGPHDDPAFLVAELETKGQELQRVVSETIMKTIKMPEPPKKGQSSGGKKGSSTGKGKGKGKKSKSSGSSTTTSTESAEGLSSASGKTSTPTTTAASVRDEL